MKAFYFLTIAVLICFTCKAQSDVNKQIADKIVDLKKEGVTTIVSYYMCCVGSVRTFNFSDTTCYGGDAHYLLWVKNNSCYLKKFDECRQYPSQVTTKTILSIVSSNYKKIKQENINPPTYDDVIEGKKEELVVYVDHSCISNFNFFTSGTSFAKTIDDYALETKYIQGKYFNKSYQYNHSTVLYKLNNLIEKELKRLKL